MSLWLRQVNVDKFLQFQCSLTLALLIKFCTHGYEGVNMDSQGRHSKNYHRLSGVRLYGLGSKRLIFNRIREGYLKALYRFTSLLKPNAYWIPSNYVIDTPLQFLHCVPLTADYFLVMHLHLFEGVNLSMQFMISRSPHMFVAGL